MRRVWPVPGRRRVWGRGPGVPACRRRRGFPKTASRDGWRVSSRRPFRHFPCRRPPAPRRAAAMQRQPARRAMSRARAIPGGAAIMERQPQPAVSSAMATASRRMSASVSASTAGSASRPASAAASGSASAPASGAGAASGTHVAARRPRFVGSAVMRKDGRQGGAARQERRGDRMHVRGPRFRRIGESLRFAAEAVRERELPRVRGERGSSWTRVSPASGGVRAGRGSRRGDRGASRQTRRGQGGRSPALRRAA